MKHIFILIIILIPCLTFSNKHVLTIDFLLQTRFEHLMRWQYHSLYPANYSLGESDSSKIEFGYTNIDSYFLVYSEECGSWSTTGKFEISNGVVHLYPTLCDNHGENVDCSKSFFGEGICHIEESKDDLLYSKYFVCKPIKGDIFTCSDTYNINEHFKFPLYDTRIKPGTKRNIDGFSVITMGQILAVTTHEALLKKLPEMKSKTIEFNLSNKILPFNKVPAKTQILIIARTENKHRINDSSNYWYYINVGYTEGVWIFGDNIIFSK